MKWLSLTVSGTGDGGGHGGSRPLNNQVSATLIYDGTVCVISATCLLTLITLFCLSSIVIGCSESPTFARARTDPGEAPRALCTLVHSWLTAMHRLDIDDRVFQI